MRNLSGIPLADIQGNVVSFGWFLRVEIPAASFVHYTDRPTNYDDAGEIGGVPDTTWISYDFKIGSLVQNQSSPLDVSFIDIQNLDNVWSSYVLNDGIRFRSVQIYMAWFDATTDAFLGSMLVYDGRTDEAHISGPRVNIALSPHRTPWNIQVPVRRFTTTCMYLYKDPDTCQSTANETTCARTLEACGSHTGGNSASQTTRFGGFNLMPPPNFKFIWGDVVVTAPPYTPPQGPSWKTMYAIKHVNRIGPKGGDIGEDPSDDPPPV